jgi:hypothetical protein
MAMRLTGIGSQYLLAMVDARKEYLDGAKTYKVTLPKSIPAANFWSFTVYDNQARSMIDTPQGYPQWSISMSWRLHFWQVTNSSASSRARYTLALLRPVRRMMSGAVVPAARSFRMCSTFSGNNRGLTEPGNARLSRATLSAWLMVKSYW